jgi:subtilase family serine protease
MQNRMLLNTLLFFIALFSIQPQETRADCSNVEMQDANYCMESGFLSPAGGEYEFQNYWIDSSNMNSFLQTMVNVPDITTSSALISFGDLLVGHTSIKDLTVCNNGSAPLEISPLQLTGTNASEFHIANDYCSNQTLQPNSCCDCQSAFIPISAGLKSAQIIIPSNDVYPPYDEFIPIALSGTGILDNDPPSGSIIINAGASFTNSTTVNLTLFCSDSGSGCYQMRFSNDNSAWSPWENYSSSKTWALTLGDGTKTVYAQFKDHSENTSTSYNDMILLQTTANTDLTISSVFAPSTSGAGLTITVGDTTRNSGGGAAATSTTNFYLSVNAAWDTGDTLLGSRSVPALASNASSTGTISVTIPAGTSPGTYYIIARADAQAVIPETNESNNTRSDTISIGPDLTISSVTAPASSGAGLTITIGDTTRNSGGGAAAASTTSLYLSTNTALDASDTLLGSRSIPLLGPNATNSGTISVTIPAGTSPGTYYIIAKADAQAVIPETNEGNNTRSDTISIGPDLTISSVTAPASSGAGLTITIGDTTRNSGGGATAASTTSLYLSTNTALDASDTLLGSRSVPALNANASSSGTIPVTIPAGTTPGTYYIIAKADASAAVAETSEANNTGSDTLLLGPDLTITSVTAPATSGAGLTITIGDTTMNSGGGAAAASTTSLYLSTNTALDASDTLLGSRSVPALAPNASSSGTIPVTIPAGTSPGTYYIIARADAQAVIPETNEGNNTGSDTIIIGADLTISSVTAPSTSGAGLTITVGDTTRNSGGGTAATSTTSYYLSTNTAWDAADTLLGSRSVPALNANASSSGTIPVTIPTGTAPGTYYIIAKADASAAVAETTESNNIGSDTIAIGPDLTVTAVSAPSTSGAGLTITVGDTTRNSGGGTAATSTTSYYLSTNTALDASDTLLGSRSVPALNANASSSGTIPVTIPTGTAPATYYIIAKTDAPAAVAETSEANNTAYRTVVIR